MATKLEALKARAEKLATEEKELASKIEEMELEELRFEEFQQKSAGALVKVSDATKMILDGEGIVIPAGKIVMLKSLEDGAVAASFRDEPAERKARVPGDKTTSGTGTTRTTITYEGRETNWAGVADQLGVAYGKGSAHAALAHSKDAKIKAVHDSITHECPYAKVEKPAEAAK